jgi:putative membrane protein
MHGCSFGRALGWGGWWIEGILCLLAVGAALYLLTRLLGSKSVNRDRRDSLEILKLRLAKGEISLEEYTTLKNVL